MTIFRDNYTDNVRKKIGPLATLGLILVSAVLLSGLLLAFSDTRAVVAFMVISSLLVFVKGGGGVLANQTGAVSTKHLEPAHKWPIEKKLIASGATLTIGGPTVLGSANINTPFPFGEAYRTILLEFNISVVIGTGSGAISEGELNFIRNIYLKTDKHGALVDNVCGRALYYRARKIMKTAPYKDAMAATTAVYNVSIPIHFTNNRVRRPEDTIVDMANVKSLEFIVSLGSVADLFTTVGTSSVTCTCDITIEKTKKPIEEGSSPIFQPYLSQLGPIDPSVLQYIEVPKIPDLGFADLMVFMSNSATAGVPWSGTPSNNTLSRITLEDNKTGKTFDTVPVQTIMNDNKLKFQFETKMTGCAILDVCEDDSLWSAYGVGDKAKMQVNWTNGTLSTSQVSALIDGTVTVRAAAAQ